MADAFNAGTEKAGNEVCVLHVGRMRIGGYLGCEYCHGKGEGRGPSRLIWDRSLVLTSGRIRLSSKYGRRAAEETAG